MLLTNKLLCSNITLWLNHNKLQERRIEGMAITLAAARVNAGLSRKEVCTALKIHIGTLENYENYKTKPDIDRAKEIATLYGCGLDDLKWSME